MDATELLSVQGGSFLMGDDRFYPEEAPPVEVEVAPFRLSRGPVCNDDFASFVSETGYVTTAERAAGSMVFVPTRGPVPLDDPARWWRWVPGACWRHPSGPGTGVEDRAEHPAVHVSYDDATAYAAWAGGRLPTEAEWELAARAGTTLTTYAWGDDVLVDGRLMANTWQGRFPYENLGAQGWHGTSPVGAFPPNAFGFLDLIGNVWEWTSDVFHHRLAVSSPCCGPPMDPLGAAPSSGSLGSMDPLALGGGSDRVLKGGSHLCAPEYCHRYRPAARSPHAPGSGASHIGFRTAGP